MKRILIIGALPASLVNFRGPLLEALSANGHTVYAAVNGRDANTEAKLKGMGVEYCPIRIARTGMNLLADLVTLFDMFQLINRIKPDVVLSYTIKPVIYGGIAAWLCGVRSIYSLITGLGYAFMDGAPFLVRWLAKVLYRASLYHSCRVFFQNPDDKSMFINMGILDQDKAVLVNGSGVDLFFFSFADINSKHDLASRQIRFLLIARLLRDKGICEYAEAASIVKHKYPQVEFHLVGEFDPNPAGLRPEEVRAWESEGLICFQGQQMDVRPFLRDCHVYVLPSFYREGIPRTVLEAMSMGRAVITTDAPGCRETVKQTIGTSECSAEQNNMNLKIGLNGILVPVKNVKALVSAMEFFIKHPNQIEIMGKESRAYAEERYDVHKVNDVIIREMGLGK